MRSGYNIGGWFSQCKEYSLKNYSNFINANELDILKQSKAKLIRLPFDIKALYSEDLKLIRAHYEVFVEKVNMLLENDFEVILDLHIAPWHFFMDGFSDKKIELFYDKAKMELHLQKLIEVSEPFKNNPKVYIEVLNEPVSDSVDNLNKFYDYIINGLRKAGYNNKIIIESNRWGSVDTFNDLQYFDDSIIYSFHFYNPVEFTHQKAPWLPALANVEYPYPFTLNGQEVNKDYLENLLEPVLNFREKYNAEVFCGEYGVYLGVKAEYRYKWLDDLLSLFKKYEIPHTYWSFKNMDFGVIQTEEKYLSLPEYKNGFDENLYNLLNRYF